MKGRLLIVNVYSVSCGICRYSEATQYARSWREAAKIMRDLGWKTTKVHGWICYNCAQEQQPAAKDEQEGGEA